jgi:hypothetical protein
LSAVVAAIVVVLAGAAIFEYAQNTTSHGYPTAAVSQLVAQCRQGGGTASYCSCTVDKLQATYSYEDFQHLDSATAADLGRTLGRACAGESHEYPAAFQQQLLSDCATEGLPDARCSCMLNAVQSRFTYADYADLEARLLTTGERPPELEQALAPCDAQP